MDLNFGASLVPSSPPNLLILDHTALHPNCPQKVKQSPFPPLSNLNHFALSKIHQNIGRSFKLSFSSPFIPKFSSYALLPKNQLSSPTMNRSNSVQMIRMVFFSLPCFYVNLFHQHYSLGRQMQLPILNQSCKIKQGRHFRLPSGLHHVLGIPQ